MFEVICYTLVFLFLFWLMTSRFPRVGEFFTDLGDDICGLIFDKRYTNEYNKSVNLFGLIASKIRKFCRWIKSKFQKDTFTEN